MIRFEIVGIKGSDVLIRITEQKYRGNDFFIWKGAAQDYFRYDGFLLQSCELPDYKVGFAGDVFFVRGRNRLGDNNIVVLPMKKYERFRNAVEEYNKRREEC